jgi:hypothetical protein
MDFFDHAPFSPPNHVATGLRTIQFLFIIDITFFIAARPALLVDCCQAWPQGCHVQLARLSPSGNAARETRGLQTISQEAKRETAEQGRDSNSSCRRFNGVKVV